MSSVQPLPSQSVSASSFQPVNELKQKNAVDLSSFQERIFKPSAGPSPSVMGSGTGSSVDFMADISAFIRNVPDSLSVSNPIGSYNPDYDIGPVGHAMGASTAINALQAIFSLQKSVKGLALARERGDLEGIAFCKADLVARTGQFFGGGGYLALRIAEVSNTGFHAGLPALSELGKFGALFGNLGFALFFAVYSGIGAYTMHRNGTFYQKLNEKGSELEKMQMLQELLAPGEVSGDVDYLQKQAKRFVGSCLHSYVKEQLTAAQESDLESPKIQEMIEEMKNTTQEEWEEIGETFLKEHTLSPECLKDLGLDEKKWDANRPLLDQIGEFALQMKQGLVKEIELERIIGSKNVQSFKQAQKSGLLERLSSPSEQVRDKAIIEAKAISSEIGVFVERNRFWNRTMQVGCVLGAGIMLALALSFGVAIFLNPYVLLALGVLSVICYIGMLFGDGGYWYEAMQSDGPVGTRDKAYMYFCMAVGVIATGIGIALASTPIGFACVVAIGILWMSVYGYQLHLLHKQEKRFKEANPTVDDFRRAVMDLQIRGCIDPKYGELEDEHLLFKGKNPLDDKGRMIFQKLPTIQKERMYMQLLSMIKKDKARERQLQEAIEERLGVERVLQCNAVEKQENESFAISKGREFYQNHPGSPVIGKVQSSFLGRFGYVEKDLLSKALEAKFYAAIYDQVALEIREAIYEEASVDDLVEAANVVLGTDFLPKEESAQQEVEKVIPIGVQEDSKVKEEVRLIPVDEEVVTPAQTWEGFIKQTADVLLNSKVASVVVGSVLMGGFAMAAVSLLGRVAVYV